MFFFEPQPFVNRVIFIGTPHRGSAWASRVVGRTAADRVRQPGDRQQLHQELVTGNPGLLIPEYQQRIPTSVDLMQPESPLLGSMQQLQVSPAVTMHSIIGWRRRRWRRPSDGVVPVSSARQAGTASECFVDASHGQLTQSDDTRDEVLRILAEHLQDFQSRIAGMSP
jgi:hypothetical protein